MNEIHVAEYTTLWVEDKKVSVYDIPSLHRAGLKVSATYKDTVPNRTKVRVVTATRPVEVEVHCLLTGNRRVVCLS